MNIGGCRRPRGTEAGRGAGARSRRDEIAGSGPEGTARRTHCAARPLVSEDTPGITGGAIPRCPAVSQKNVIGPQTQGRCGARDSWRGMIPAAQSHPAAAQDAVSEGGTLTTVTSASGTTPRTMQRGRRSSSRIAKPRSLSQTGRLRQPGTGRSDAEGVGRACLALVGGEAAGVVRNGNLDWNRQRGRRCGTGRVKSVMSSSN